MKFTELQKELIAKAIIKEFQKHNMFGTNVPWRKLLKGLFQRKFNIPNKKAWEGIYETIK